MDLLPSTTAIAPGRPFFVGTRFRIAPGWHIYAEDPGETGLPTRVTLRLPEGYVAGPTRYPPPRRFVSSGPITSYGYEDQVVLFHRVDPPAAPAGSGKLMAQARWLACKDSCIPGRADLDVTLPLASPAAPARPTHRETFSPAGLDPPGAPFWP